MGNSELASRIRLQLRRGLIIGLALLLIFCIALFLRIYFPYDNVFGGDYVRFQINDPWYHMRLVENLAQHFPQRIAFDPFTLFPYGQDVPFAPFFDLLLGFFIWVIGLGSPSRQMIETVGAYFPAILGALVSLPVYFMGRELFNRKAGLLAAALIAILPGQFLMRTLLGFTDHHVAETLFSALAVMFLILAVKSSKQKGLSYNNLWRRDWGSMRKPLIYSLLTGIALGCYLLSWVGGALLVFIIFVYAIIQSIIDHLRGRSTDYLCIIGVPSFLVALLMVAPFSGQIPGSALQVSALIIGMLAFLGLSALSFLMASKKIRRAYYPLALAGLGGIGLAGFYLIAPSLLASILGKFSVFAPTVGALTITEVMPLSLSSAWEQFTTGFFLALISLIIIAYLVIREGAADKTLLLVWSVIMLAATLGQNRFAYYFAVNVALLTGYLSWEILRLSGFRKPPEGVAGEGDAKGEKARLRKEAKRKKEKARRRETRAPVTRYLSTRYAYGMIAIVVVFFLAFYPNIPEAIDSAGADRGPQQDWHDSLVWMRDNTPEPFEDPDFYYELYDRPPARQRYDYPESAYGVMSWWDYGHWITYTAHRIPNANPFQAGARDAALFFTAQDESSANEVLDRLGSKYVIIDYLMATGKFYAMAIWTGASESQFFEVYHQRTAEGELEPMTLFYPEYYQSMCVRLYNFGGQAVVPDDSTWVISYTEHEDGSKEITSARRFATYEEAVDYLESQSSPNYRIVGVDRFASPVPLEELDRYQLVYQSPSTVLQSGDERVSYVEIFEYVTP